MTTKDQILNLIAEGWYIRSEDDRYIICENPNYQPDDGSNPHVVYDIHEGKDIECHKCGWKIGKNSAEAMQPSYESQLHKLMNCEHGEDE